MLKNASKSFRILIQTQMTFKFNKVFLVQRYISVAVADQVPDLIVHYTIAFEVHNHMSRHSWYMQNVRLRIQFISISFSELYG